MNEKDFKEIMEKVFRTPTTDGIPDICKNCDVFNYGMPSEYCNDCDGPKYFFYGDDE